MRVIRKERKYNMISKIINKSAKFLAVLTLLLVPLVTVQSGIAAVDLSSQLECGAEAELDTTTGKCTLTTGAKTPDLPAIATQILTYFSWIVGLIAVIMLIVGGLKYITSGGDSNKVSSAKNTIIYALIGLVIVALAQVIVHFVLQKTSEVIV